jgi:CubicO group peptidase (beta-lactamase class C family)
MKKALVLTVFTFAMLFTACAAHEASTNVIPPDVPENQPAASAVKEHIKCVDVELIEQMKQDIGKNNINIKSFILIKDGETIDETYFDPSAQNSPARIFSCTKSVLSALTGIAIDEGRIASVDVKITDMLDMHNISISDEAISDITLKDALTMSSGLSICPSDEYLREHDPIKYILEQPMESEPESVFAYTGTGPHIVSAIIRKATGMETSLYAQEKLFDPLSIAPPEWTKDLSGLAVGGSGLYLTPRQLAKLGMLYLGEGVYDGKRIISREWVRESTGFAIDTSFKKNDGETSGYGYYWWLNGFGGYAAHGYAGQYIFVLPEKNAVAVFTSQLGEPDFPIPYGLMEQYVVPALG